MLKIIAHVAKAIWRAFNSLINLIWKPNNKNDKPKQTATPTLSCVAISVEAKAALQQFEAQSPGLIADLEAHYTECNDKLREYTELMQKIGERDDTEATWLQYQWQGISNSALDGKDIFCDTVEKYLQFRTNNRTNSKISQHMATIRSGH